MRFVAVVEREVNRSSILLNTRTRLVTCFVNDHFMKGRHMSDLLTIVHLSHQCDMTTLLLRLTVFTYSRQYLTIKKETGTYVD